MSAAERRWSLGRRLALIMAAAVTALWLGAAAVAGVVLRREVDAFFDGALKEVAQRILPLAYAEMLAREADDPPQHLAPVGAGRESVTYVVRGADGRELLRSSDADPARVPKDLADGFQTVEGLRLYTESAVRGTIRVTTIEPLAHRDAAVRNAVLALTLPLAALAPLALGVILLLGRATLAPVKALRERIEARGRGRLDALGEMGLPDEIAPVAGALDALLERLRGALEAERSFTANAAHELRTPVAAALAQCQRLLAESPDGATRERARSLAGALRRLSTLSEKLLQLAKAEGGGLVAEKPGPLGPALALVVEEARRRHDAGDRLTMTQPEGGGTPSDIDPDAFAILARNLIENALRHGDPDGPVAARLADDAFEVENEAAPVSPETLARLARRFERGGAVTEGTGLGLAIVEAICRGVGATLELRSPAPGRATGFLARVAFPRRAEN